MHRPRPRASEDRESTRQYRRQLVGAHQRMTERRHVGAQTALRGQLVKASTTHAQLLGVVDARDHQHRNGIAVGLAHRREDIGHAGTGDDEAHAGFAGHPGISVRHESCALFVPRGDVPDARRGQSPIELHGVHTRNAEYGIDAEIFQEPHQKLAARQHGGFPSGFSRQTSDSIVAGVGWRPRLRLRLRPRRSRKRRVTDRIRPAFGRPPAER